MCIRDSLQAECGLPVNPDVPLIGIVTRLTWQKGLDLIIDRMDELMKRDVQAVSYTHLDVYKRQRLYSIFNNI